MSDNESSLAALKAWIRQYAMDHREVLVFGIAFTMILFFMLGTFRVFFALILAAGVTFLLSGRMMRFYRRLFSGEDA